MKKCDFCTASTYNGKCYYADNTLVIREPYCKKAITLMSKTLQNTTIKKGENKR